MKADGSSYVTVCLAPVVLLQLAAPLVDFHSLVDRRSEIELSLITFFFLLHYIFHD